MPDQTAEAFRALDEKLQAAPDEQQRLSDLRDYLVDRLGRESQVSRLVDAGSFLHRTEVSGFSWFDVFVVLGGSRPAPLPRSLALIRAAVPPDVTDVRQNPAGDSLLVEAAVSTGVRLIPVYEGAPAAGAAVHPLLVADQTKRWVATLPGAREALLNRIDDGGLRALVRLVLLWKHRLQLPISSYYLETAVVRQTLRQPSFSPLWDVCWLFEQLAADDLASLSDVSSPTQNQKVRAAPSLARRIEAQLALDATAATLRGAINSYLDDDVEAVDAALTTVFGVRWEH